MKPFILGRLRWPVPIGQKTSVVVYVQIHETVRAAVETPVPTILGHLEVPR